MQEIVWHYTDMPALISMAEHATLRATDFRYLNDAVELTYTWDPFVKRLVENATDTGPRGAACRAALKALWLTDSVDLMGYDDSVFVTCFTDLGDAVSQWSRYGANGHGVALGFVKEAIEVAKVPHVTHFTGGRVENTKDAEGDDVLGYAFLERVRYGDAERDAMVDGLMTMVEQNAKSSGSFDYAVGNWVFQMSAMMQRLPSIKHDAFSDEKESRFMLTEHWGGRSASQMRALSKLRPPYSAMARGELITHDVRFLHGGRTVIRPYVTVPFDRSALVAVTLGPSIRNAIVKPTVRRLLDRYGYRDAEVEVSALPYQT